MNIEYRDPMPLFIAGKARLSESHRQATLLVSWAGGIFADREIRRDLPQFVRNCYPEATAIKLWRVPGTYNMARVTFRIETPPRRKPKRKGQEISWTWRYV